MGKALVLLSGGLDSSTCAAMAVKAHGAENVHALTIFYGQKHQTEIEAAKNIAEALGLASHSVVSLPLEPFKGAGSTLIDPDKPNPELTYQQIAESTGPSPTYVPFRNANLLSLATAIALRDGCEEVYYGPHAEDARNFAYPDCTPEFNGAMANAIFVGTYFKVKLITPLQWMMKADVAWTALELGVPIELTHSCYNGKRPACGKCPTCVERIEAFKAIGVKDPLPYEIQIDWGDCR
jgi:7-cyano-7-deazaguanine synthase